MKLTWKHFAPIVVAIVIALIPAPAGLPQHAWYYFAIFAGVIVGLMLEPLPGGAIGLIGVTLVARLSDYVFYSPEQLAKPGFNPDAASLSWALSGFSNATVWLIFGAFMFALGYEKTGLGRRIALMLVKAMGRKTLTLGYAVASTLFLTALAPNLLAVELVKKTAKIDLAWVEWFIAAAPMGILLLIFVPLLAYWIYPPEVKEGAEVSDWAAKELVKMGGLTAKEITLAVLVVIALAMWIFRAEEVNATTAALIVICLMLVTNVVTWDDITKNFPAWNTLAWFATLVALAGGLSQVGFVKWFAEVVANHMAGFTPVKAILLLLVINFFTHYMFASVTAHVTALIPVLLAVGSTIPDMNMQHLALLLCLQLGIMGIITPYGAGPSPVYYGSGYLPAADYWRLGAIFGVIFFVVFMVLTVPWVLLRG